MSIDKFINKSFTFQNLVDEFKPSMRSKYTLARVVLKGIQNYFPSIYSNGRVNHYWFQEMLSFVTKGAFVSGGQGNGLPDLWTNINNQLNKRTEVKGMTEAEFLNNKPLRVAASKFFASNGGMTEIKKLPTTEQIAEHVMAASYNDDYYLLSETCGLSKNLEDVNIILVETKLLKNCLIKEVGSHSYVDASGGKRKMKIDTPAKYVDMQKLKQMVEKYNAE